MKIIYGTFETGKIVDFINNDSVKVSGNPCGDHNLNINSLKRKKTLLQLFLYFSGQRETENYKLIYESLLGIVSRRVKFALHLVHFITIFKLQL